MVHLDPNYPQRFKKFAQYFGNIEINQDVISEYFPSEPTPSPPNSLHSGSFYHFTPRYPLFYNPKFSIQFLILDLMLSNTLLQTGLGFIQTKRCL